MSLISAISYDRIIANQFIEGGVDATLFENFIYNLLWSVRNDKDLCRKKVVLFMDNAVIHKSSTIIETARKMKAIVLFNAEYSPWLNPIEQLFNFLKTRLSDDEKSSR